MEIDHRRIIFWSELLDFGKGGKYYISKSYNIYNYEGSPCFFM